MSLNISLGFDEVETDQRQRWNFIERDTRAPRHGSALSTRPNYVYQETSEILTRSRRCQHVHIDTDPKECILVHRHPSSTNSLQTRPLGNAREWYAKYAELVRPTADPLSTNIRSVAPTRIAASKPADQATGLPGRNHPRNDHLNSASSPGRYNVRNTGSSGKNNGYPVRPPSPRNDRLLPLTTTTNKT